MFTVGGTGVILHKYLGTIDQSIGLTVSAAQATPGATLTFANTDSIKLGQFAFGSTIPNGAKVIGKTPTTITLSTSTTAVTSSGATVKFSDDATQPAYLNTSSKNIQDLLFLENRDRKYDTDVYTLRGIYNVSDSDFDLSQFGLFLNTGTLFMVFHINDMVDLIGRRIMNGDVLELQHLKDYNALDETLPVALKRYYVVSDTNRASEGFSPTWWAHLWRVKLQPLVDSQEYKDLLNNIKAGDDTNDSLADILSTYQKYIDINDSIILQAETDVPYSGYDTSPLYNKALKPDGYPADPLSVSLGLADVDASSTILNASASALTPDKTIEGYLTGDGLAPNGIPVLSGVAFPTNPSTGAYFLRLDYKPNRLFRFNGSKWVKIEDRVRTRLTPGPDNQTLRSTFVNNTNTFNNSNNEVVNERQALNEIFKPRAD